MLLFKFFNIFLAFIKLIYILQKMYKENMPSVFDTSDSFYPSSQFDYHSKKADYECRIMLQNKEKAISSLLQQQPIKKKQLEELIGYIQKETDSMISELLSEATHLRQKLRTQKDCYQTTIRELKSRLRSLSEENMEIVSQLQLKERVHKEEVQQLSKNKKATILQKSNLGKQIEGMQRLLNQYQIELEKKQGQILLLKKQMQEKTAFCQTAKSQILNQSTVIQELKQRVYLLQRQYKTQQIINSTQKGNQINLLMKKDFVFHTQINDREYLIRSLDEEALKKEKQIQSLVETVKKLNQLLQMEKSKQKIEKNSEKDSILKLQTATQTAITLIRQKHNDKLQKIAELMKKQLKKLKKQIQAFKVSTIKQIQLCQKQTKGVLISQLKTLHLK